MPHQWQASADSDERAFEPSDNSSLTGGERSINQKCVGAAFSNTHLLSPTFFQTLTSVPEADVTGGRDGEQQSVARRGLDP